MVLGVPFQALVKHVQARFFLRRAQQRCILSQLLLDAFQATGGFVFVRLHIGVAGGQDVRHFPQAKTIQRGIGQGEDPHALHPVVLDVGSLGLHFADLLEREQAEKHTQRRNSSEADEGSGCDSYISQEHGFSLGLGTR